MSTAEEENKALDRRTFEEIFNQGNLALVDELVAPDFLNHEVPPSMNNRGSDSTRQVVAMLRTAFPDLHFTIEELVADQDTVAGRVTMSGTHLGPFRGIPPTGRSFQQAHIFADEDVACLPPVTHDTPSSSYGRSCAGSDVSRRKPMIMRGNR